MATIRPSERLSTSFQPALMPSQATLGQRTQVCGMLIRSPSELAPDRSKPVSLASKYARTPQVPANARTVQIPGHSNLFRFWIILFWIAISSSSTSTAVPNLFLTASTRSNSFLCRGLPSSSTSSALTDFTGFTVVLGAGGLAFGGATCFALLM